MTMDWTEALEIVIERSKKGGQYGHERYRVLTADDHPDHGLWRRKVLELVGQKPPPEAEERPTVAQSAELLRQMKACHFRSVSPGCGCSGAWCSLKVDASGRRPAIVSHQDCFACLKRHTD
jgi:hypothetical protein